MCSSFWPFINRRGVLSNTKISDYWNADSIESAPERKRRARNDDDTRHTVCLVVTGKWNHILSPLCPLSALSVFCYVRFMPTFQGNGNGIRCPGGFVSFMFLFFVRVKQWMAVVSEHLRRFVCNVPGFMHVWKRDLLVKRVRFCGSNMAASYWKQPIQTDSCLARDARIFSVYIQCFWKPPSHCHCVFWLRR